MNRQLAFCLSTGLLMSACTTTQVVVVKEPARYNRNNVSHQAEMIESTNPEEWMVRATGQGATTELALADAKRAVVWYVLFGGRTRMLQTQDDQNAVTAFEHEIFENAPSFITFESGIKGKRSEGGKTFLTKNYRVRVDQIRGFLETRNVIASQDEINEKLDLPIVMITKPTNGDEAFAATVMGDYFQSRGFEVNVVNNSDKTNAMVDSILALEGEVDPAFSLAMSLGADVLVKVDAFGEEAKGKFASGQQGSVSVKAFYSTTGRQLAASTGFSAARVGAGAKALINEAANDAAERLSTAMQAQWRKELNKGRPLALVVTAASDIAKAVDEPLYDTVRGMCKAKRTVAGKTTFRYELRCSDIASGYDLYKAIKDEYSGPGSVNRLQDFNSMVILSIGYEDGADVNFY